MKPFPAPGLHGGDGAAVATALGLDPDEVLDLSQSLNPVAPDPRPVVARHLDALGHYPDTSTATAALAQCMGVDKERLLLTNGGSEAISLIAAALGGWCNEPEFSLLPRSAKGGPGLPLWRSNPNNPTGLLARAQDRANVWDEAFFPLATGQWTRGDTESVVVGSLTKLLACPGLRVGYVLADPNTIATCRDRQPAWSVNSLAAAALPDLLESMDLPKWCAAVADLRRELVDVLRGHGLEPRPSDANWVLVEAPGLRERLAPQGIVVRDCTSFGLPGVSRIAVPSPDGIARLDKALAAIEGA